MPSSDARFHQRMLGRTLLFIVLPTAALLIVVIVLSIRRDFGTMRLASENMLRMEAMLAADQIEEQNQIAVVTAQRMAEAQMAGMFGDRKMSIEFARRVLEGSPQLTAAFIGYEPNADGRDAESIEMIPSTAMSASGRFIPYWFEPVKKGTQENRTIELEPLVDMETSLYYQGAKEAFARTQRPTPMITEPYVYQGKMIVEHVYPIVVNGAFAGVAGVDRALRDVSEAMDELGSRLEADVFLISSRGNFIAATTDSNESPQDGPPGETAGALKTRAVAETPYRDLFGRITADTQHSSLRLEADPTDGNRHYFAAAHIPLGNWTIVLRRSEAAILAPVWSSLRLRIAMAVLALALVITLLTVSVLRVSKRLRIAVNAASRVARGDLTEDIDPGKSPDETGSLLRELRTMTNKLNEFIGLVKQAAIRINSTATQLSATSRQQESVAQQFGSSSSEIAAAVKQISATGNELTDTMSQVSQVASDTASLATTGRAGLQGMEDTMRGLDDATGSIAEKLAAINEKASNITSVVTTITKVAEQTNLLSVNAAIEAEKAGEYGVGFLVVAREIRRLADQSATATLDIEQMVQQMQGAVSAGVMEMDRFSDHVRRSVTDVGQVSQQLSQIIEQVNANCSSFERVNEGMQSQSQGADQISLAMEQLTGGATQTLEAIREYASAADDLQDSIQSLKESVAKFHLRA